MFNLWRKQLAFIFCLSSWYAKCCSVLISFTYIHILHFCDYWPCCGVLVVLWLAVGSLYWDEIALGSLLLGLPAPPALLSESDRSLSRSWSVPIEQLRDRPKPTPLLLLWLSWCWWSWLCPRCPRGDLLRRWWLLELDAAATDTGSVCWLEMHEISTDQCSHVLWTA